MAAPVKHPAPSMHLQPLKMKPRAPAPPLHLQPLHMKTPSAPQPWGSNIPAGALQGLFGTGGGGTSDGSTPAPTDGSGGGGDGGGDGGGGAPADDGSSAQPASNDGSGQYDDGMPSPAPDAPTTDDGSSAPPQDDGSTSTDDGSSALPGPGLPPPRMPTHQNWMPLSTGDVQPQPPATTALAAPTPVAPTATIAAHKPELVGAGLGAVAGALVLGPVGAAAGALAGAAAGWWKSKHPAAPPAAAMSGETPTTLYLTARKADLVTPARYYGVVPKPVLDVFASWALAGGRGVKRFGAWEAHARGGVVQVFGPPFKRS